MPHDQKFIHYSQMLIYEMVIWSIVQNHNLFCFVLVLVVGLKPRDLCTQSIFPTSEVHTSLLPSHSLQFSKPEFHISGYSCAANTDCIKFTQTSLLSVKRKGRLCILPVLLKPNFLTNSEQVIV